MAVKTPKIQHILKQIMVRQKQPFHFSIKQGFWPLDGSLRFELIGEAPHWIIIDTRTGVISGFAPPTIYDRQYLLTVKAYNEYGEETQHFFLKVVATDVIEDIAHRLKLILTPKYKHYRFGAMHPYVHDPLDYIFEYFMHSDNPELFLEQLKKNAEKLKIRLSDDIKYEDFKKVVKTMTPEIEKELQKQLGAVHMAAIAELNNTDFYRLYLQGSQPLGAHAIAVWNYLGAPSMHNWSSTKTVLDAASEAIITLRQENMQNTIEHKNTFSPSKTVS